MQYLALYNQYSAKTAGALAALCAVSVFCYGAFLLLAVSHAAKLRGVESEISSIESKVSTLQAIYLERSKALTPELARAMGFVEPSSQVTVYFGGEGLSLAPGSTRSETRGGASR